MKLLRYLMYSTFALATISYSGNCIAQKAPMEFFCNESLDQINLDIRNDKYGKLSSFVVFQGSSIVYEKYYGFSQISTLHPISSVTKSIASIAVGIALDMGFIPSLDVSIYDYFPEYQQFFEEEPIKKQITIRHLLKQTSGFDWDEWDIHYSYADNPLIILSQKPESWIPIILNLPMVAKPGEHFTYNSALSELLKEIVARASRQPFLAFVEENVLDKLNIENFHWDTYPNNGVPAWGGLSLSTRDMAKFGILVINNGNWSDQRVVSQDWISMSILPHAEADSLSYGFNWWIGEQPDGRPLIFAAGYGDQYIYIAPDKNLVIAFNGKNFTDHKWEKEPKDLVMRILNAFVN